MIPACPTRCVSRPARSPRCETGEGPPGRAAGAGIDGLPTLRFRFLHIGDTMTAVDPDDVPRRFEVAGLGATSTEVLPSRFRFRAQR